MYTYNVHICIYIYKYICVCTCIYIYICIYICITYMYIINFIGHLTHPHVGQLSASLPTEAGHVGRASLGVS